MAAENKVLIAMHHGSHDKRTGELSEKGVRQMTHCAEVLRRVAVKRGLKFELLCSTEPPAMQSMEIICGILHIPLFRVIYRDDFWMDNTPEYAERIALAKGLLEPLFRKNKLVLLVSDRMMTNLAIRYMAPLMSKDGKSEEVPHGRGLMLSPQGTSLFPKD